MEKNYLLAEILIIVKEIKKKIMCSKCAHNLKLNSCGSCSATAIKMVHNIQESIQEDDPTKGNSGPSHERPLIEEHKYSCKIVANDPEEFNSVDPEDCKYFMNKALNFF